jgi:hypothetical protein
MLKQVLGFLASSSVAILIAAAGLYFDVAQLAYFGGGLLAVVASTWLLLRFNPRPDGARAKAIWEDRRDLIDAARTLVARHNRGEAGGKSFRDFLEAAPLYPRLRRHLSRAYVADLENRRMTFANSGNMDHLAFRLIEELDRLETKWGLDRA